MQLVTIKIVAELLMVKESTLYSWVHNGSIPFHKLNGLIRFDMDEIKAWIEASKKLPGPRLERRETNHQDIAQIVKKAIPRIDIPRPARDRKRLLATTDSSRERAVPGGHVSRSRQDGKPEVAPLDGAKGNRYNRIQRETRPNTGSQKEG